MTEGTESGARSDGSVSNTTGGTRQPGVRRDDCPSWCIGEHDPEPVHPDDEPFHQGYHDLTTLSLMPKIDGDAPEYLGVYLHHNPHDGDKYACGPIITMGLNDDTDAIVMTAVEARAVGEALIAKADALEAGSGGPSS